MKWTFDGHGINDENGTRICKITHLEPYTDGNKRNVEFDRISSLIAAAPEMLDEMKNLIELLGNDDDATASARALIARVEKD